MKSLTILLASLCFSFQVFAATEDAKAKVSSKKTETATSASSATGRSHNFEDLLVNGKYHFADEAVSTVEADKVFDSLIGLRNDFKDRLEDSATSK